ncbi:MAG: DUF87 domain-containing protein [Oscillospiraceae bacterium]|nr:DUF87 domain-containing protein [Oscillospiraceae bacterium]
MGIKNFLATKAQRAGDKIARCSCLSTEQIEHIESRREEYYNKLQRYDPNDPSAVEITEKLIGLSSIEIFNAYLPQIKDMYIPVEKDAEYGKPFNSDYNIRYFNITKWVTDKEENSLEKLVNVYAVLSDEECNIALVFNRKCNKTQVYLAVVNTKNADSNTDVNRYRKQLADAIKGNFPGSEWKETDDYDGAGIIPCLRNNKAYSVATASNIPAEKSEKFLSQTIEKLLDGIVPENSMQEYTLILLATPIRDINERKLRLSRLYSGLAPYASWQTNFTYVSSESMGSSANFGVNAGVSAGVQNSMNRSVSNANGVTDSTSDSHTDTEGSTHTNQDGSSHTDTTGDTTTDTTTSTESSSSTHTTSEGSTHTATKGTNDSFNVGVNGSVATSANAGVDLGIVDIGGDVTTTVGASAGYTHGWNNSVSDALSTQSSNALTGGTSESVSSSVARNVSQAVSRNLSRSIANSTSRAVANTIGRAVTRTMTNTIGSSGGVNLGGNFGVNFARSSNITATIGNNEGITQSFTNHNIKHALELLEEQMKRFEECTALGLWDFAAYVVSEDIAIANNVAHQYIALTQGDKSYMSNSAINLWRGDMGENSRDTKEICNYLRELRHPVFGINPALVNEFEDYFVYPTTVTATTSLSGKELAYSLNFPKKSVEGFPVIECAEFGRNIITYTERDAEEEKIRLGRIYHMYHAEKNTVDLTLNSLSSHTFITGSTGSGKSNTIYKILGEAKRKNISFMVIEPAKGEYKHVFGKNKDVTVYGTNPNLSPLLRINPFSFPKDIHVLEHLDRLIEIFNVCWPMYAAMPAVLKNAVEKAYEDCGWNLTESVNIYGDNLYPQFSDVARNVKMIIDSSEYDSENKGAYKGSLLTRLNSLTNGINGLIFTDDELSTEALFDENIIIDLSRVGSTETKSLIMGMLVLKLQEYRMIRSKMNSPLKHITVLEEAHNLLKRTSTEQSSETSNILGKSVEMISNAIAEMRTYGEGFIIADQSPGLLDMSAIRNTNTKIIMRLPDIADRELVGKAANLNEQQINELSRIPCGVAAVYQNEWIQPVLCKVGKFNVNETVYEYHNEPVLKTEEKSDDMVSVAKLLSNCTKMSREAILTDILPVLQKHNIKTSVQVSIAKLLENPPTEPRMTKLAPLMSALFPKVRSAVVYAYNDNPETAEWTRKAEEALRNSLRCMIDDETRRDIIQAIITDYVYVELGNHEDIRKWAENGGLR